MKGNYFAALGPRPLLDFPDKIYMEEALVKIPLSKIIVVHNIGQIPATFNLIVERYVLIYKIIVSIFIKQIFSGICIYTMNCDLYIKLKENLSSFGIL